MSLADNLLEDDFRVKIQGSTLAMDARRGRAVFLFLSDRESVNFSSQYAYRDGEKVGLQIWPVNPKIPASGWVYDSRAASGLGSYTSNYQYNWSPETRSWTRTQESKE